MHSRFREVSLLHNTAEFEPRIAGLRSRMAQLQEQQRVAAEAA